MAEIFPALWLRPEAQDMVVALIKHIPIDPKDKKRVLHEWCVRVGVKLTAEMVEDVTGLRAGEV